MRPTAPIITALSALALLSACGGGEPISPATGAAPGERAVILKGGGSGGGSTRDVVGPSPLPTTAPAPDMIVRESFGPGPDLLRPAGGKGVLKSTYAHTTIGGFWVEWPGSKNAAWITPDGDQTWKFCGIGGYLDPYELPSPLQPDEATQGCVSSEWFDPVTAYPTALLPFTPPPTPYAVSVEGWPSVIAGGYVALGLTASNVTLSNFTTAGQVWMSLRAAAPLDSTSVAYEVRVNGMSGPLLASGVVENVTWNQMMLRYDPVAKLLTPSVNGVKLGDFPLDMPAPRYAGFEGVGILDNFVIRHQP